MFAFGNAAYRYGLLLKKIVKSPEANRPVDAVPVSVNFYEGF
jgi:hypothetical protein